MPDRDPDAQECGCSPQSGCCDNRYNGVFRRDFIALAGVGAAGLLATPSWGEWVSRQTNSPQLAAWKADLFKTAPKRKYLSTTHTDAQMPLGGIGTGNFELGADGQFTTWQLFNTLRDGHVPFCFAVNVGGAVKLLQTRGAPDWPRVRTIEMTGEYPVATLKYVDLDLPIDLEMTAFSPFAPLDPEFSAIPAACFVFKMHNPTPHAQTVSLAGFLQNAIGYDAVGVPISFNSVGFNAVAERRGVTHPNFGGNFNRVYRDGAATVLAMEAKPGAPATIDRPVDLYTNIDVRGLNSQPNDRPKELTVAGLDRVNLVPEGKQAASLIWLEDAPTNLSVEVLQAVRNLVNGGGVLVLAGGTQPLLKAYGNATGGHPVGQITMRPEVIFDDFENGYGNWKVEGTAFGNMPAQGTLPDQQEVSGFLGHGLVNSFLNGDGATGKMTSKPFTIERNYIRFLVGGGRTEATQIRLIVNGTRVRATSGNDNEKLLPAAWDVREFVGKQAHIEIVDESTAGWGHVNVDNIVFSDDPGSHALYVLLEEVLPARFSGLQLNEGAVALQDQTLREGAAFHSVPEIPARVLSRPLGKGSVHLVFGELLQNDNAEMIGARQSAYAAVCSLAGAKYIKTVGAPEKASGFGALALMTFGPDATALPAFTEWDEARKLFGANGKFDDPANRQLSEPTDAGTTINGALATTLRLAPGATKEVVFCLAWRYPNKYNGAGRWMGCHYAETWKTIGAVTKTLASDFPKMRARTERFRKTMYESTLPYWFLDCVSSQISTIRHSGVVFRIANGDVFGWEGSNGCCQPTCTHVWGYEQTLAHVFPGLERQMRQIDYMHQQREDGGIDNRTDVPSPPRPTGEQPFSDGHCSCILKAYREVLNSPDDRFLKEYWPHIKRAVQYLIARDSAASGGKPNGTLSDDQWNTYDNAIHGVNTFIGGYYLAALRAGEEMAGRMGDRETANHFHEVFQDGQKRLVDLCWNGEYFEQHLPDYMKRQGEYGPGCLSDQLIGQWWAHQLDLGYILPEDNVKTALKSIFKYNWLPDFTNFHHNWRKFAGGNDKGLLICTWPKGRRPANTIPYVDEVWTGVEYQVAAHMLYEGFMEEGLSIVKGARDRYNGEPREPMPRNPWNEIECGGHYARAMSSWSLLTALSGFRYDGPRGILHFSPRHSADNHKSLFTGPEAWGSLKQVRTGKTQRAEIAVVEGALRVKELRLGLHLLNKSVATVGHNIIGTRVTIGDRTLQIGAQLRADQDAIVKLPEDTVVRAGETLAVSVGPMRRG